MRHKILLVEDQPNWQKAIMSMLPPAQFESHKLALEECKDSDDLVQKARNLLENDHFDLIIMNMNLLGDPQVHRDQVGFTLLEFIRDDFPRLPRIVITGSPGGGIRHIYEPLKVDEVLIKGDFARSDLLQAIDRSLAGREEKLVRWLHLSDLHIGRKEKSCDWDSLAKALITDLKTHQQSQQPGHCAGVVLKADVVLITGDVAYRATPQEYKQAGELIKSLWQVLEWEEAVGRERTFVVPGNHDMNRTTVKDDPSFASAYQQLADNRLGAKEWLDAVSQWWQHRPLRNLWKRKLASFRKFAGSYTVMPTELGYFVKPLDIHGVKLDIVGLDSALPSWKDGEDLERGLWIGKPQVDDVERQFTDDADLRVVLVHHPQEALHYCDGAWNRIEQLADVILHGHLHEMRTVAGAEPEREHVRISAGAVNEGGVWQSQRYSYGCFNAKTRELDIYLRMTKPGAWPIYIRDSFTYPKAAPDGHLKLSLLKKR